jgi:hypothetical protein
MKNKTFDHVQINLLEIFPGTDFSIITKHCRRRLILCEKEEEDSIFKFNYQSFFSNEMFTRLNEAILKNKQIREIVFDGYFWDP